PWFGRPAGVERPKERGWRRCSLASRRCWSPSLSLTRWPASCGLCSSKAVATELRLQQRNTDGNQGVGVSVRRGMAQQSVRRGRDNQGFPQCLEHALGDLDLVRELPYRPAPVFLPPQRPSR